MVHDPHSRIRRSINGTSFVNESRFRPIPTVWRFFVQLDSTILSGVKLLVFAHTPPPHHGQSQMIAYLVEGFGGDARNASASGASGPHDIQVYHVNARLSEDLEDIGSARSGKVFTLLRYCFQAIALRIRHGVRTFYYVPSPPKRASLYRDWIVLFLCRPFFRRIIFHWHSVGLGEWLETHAKPWERRISRWLLGGVDLSIVLSRYNEADAARLHPKRTRIVPNGIPDPCPPDSSAEVASTGGIDRPKRVLFMALCTRDKGVHDAVRAIAMANTQGATLEPRVQFELHVAGTFVDTAEREEFDALCSKPELAGRVHYLGFLDAQGKAKALATSDLFCFPTYYANEGQPLNLIEAMAYGLPTVTTHWRAIPELFDPDHPGLVEPKHPEQVAAALLNVATTTDRGSLRRRFLERYTVNQHLKVLASSLRSVES